MKAQRLKDILILAAMALFFFALGSQSGKSVLGDDHSLEFVVWCVSPQDCK